MTAISEQMLMSDTVIYCSGFNEDQQEDWKDRSSFGQWSPECTYLILSEKIKLLLVCKLELT